jgi:hypothetical protein
VRDFIVDSAVECILDAAHGVLFSEVSAEALKAGALVVPIIVAGDMIRAFELFQYRSLKYDRDLAAAAD